MCVTGVCSHHGSGGGGERGSARLLLSVQTGSAGLRLVSNRLNKEMRWKLNADVNDLVLRVFSGYFGDDILCHFCASMISGLVTTAASMPVDIVKTRWGSRPEKDEFCLEQFSEWFSWNICVCLRIQNMRMIDGKPEYKNGLVSDVVFLSLNDFNVEWKSKLTFDLWHQCCRVSSQSGYWSVMTCLWLCCCWTFLCWL